VNVKVLQKAAQQAARITNRNSVLPILKYCVIGSNGSGLVLWTTNLESYFSTVLDKEAGPMDNLIIDPRALVETIKPMKGMIDLTVDSTGLHIGSATLASVIDPEEYPLPLRLEDVQHLATLDGKRFKQSIKRLYNQTQRDTSTTRLHLTGICFQTKSNELVLTATDGHVLESDTFPINSDVQSEYTLPAKTLKKVIAGVGAKDKVSIATGKYADMDFVRIQSGHDTYHVKAIPDEYPNFSRLFRDHVDNYHLTVDVKALLAVLQQALPATPEDKANRVCLALDSFELTITADNDTATFEHVLSVSESYGFQFTDWYNCKLLIGFLKDLGNESVTLSFQERQRAVKFTSDNVQGLLMPVKVEA